MNIITHARGLDRAEQLARARHAVRYIADDTFIARTLGLSVEMVRDERAKVRQVAAVQEAPESNHQQIAAQEAGTIATDALRNRIFGLYRRIAKERALVDEWEAAVLCGMAA